MLINRSAGWFAVWLWLCWAALPARAQQPAASAYRVQLVRAACTADSNVVVAVFSVTPTYKKAFPPILSTKIAYGFGGGPARVVDITKQPDGKKVGLVIYGKDVQTKNAQVYQLVKDRVPLTQPGDLMLLAFYFYGVATELPRDRRMSITYGLWEKRNPNLRHEQQFDVVVEDYAAPE
ncbi:hypothetical protein LJ737_23720 [Hymenobacter sp. 15J16-1T3B]|uniref:hypothetical protein n=1 Tax=Hymenobacter sp. 15J16-1T3B TaxID=2886941 RepID=UPI001D0FE8DB|nr:hypothetical protein [Hymenobacter sp. 15J16-1T3B]MCC3160266.1 hypothetical protein [Hymenobacter sp. 15J16-1T3B]